jgi:hypothetical protein
MFRIVENDRVGFMDSSGKAIFLPGIFRGTRSLIVGEFHEGLLSVSLGGVLDKSLQHVYLDRSGNAAFTTSAERANDFYEGLAPATPNGSLPKWGFIDRTGFFSIAPRDST